MRGIILDSTGRKRAPVREAGASGSHSEPEVATKLPGEQQPPRERGGGDIPPENTIATLVALAAL